MFAGIFTKRYLILLTALVTYCGTMVLVGTGVIPKFW